MSSDAQDHAVAAIVRWIDAQPKTERREPSDVQ